MWMRVADLKRPGAPAARRPVTPWCRSGQVDVKQQQVEAALLDQMHCLGTIRRRLHGIPADFEVAGEQFAHRGLVIDYENALLCHYLVPEMCSIEENAEACASTPFVGDFHTAVMRLDGGLADSQAEPVTRHV
jgi:hypothetical protein